MASDTAMLDAALSYIERGWAVFPLRPSSKQPATRRGFKDATTDPEQVRRWWCGPNANRNVGIACGAASGGLLVIDVDVDDRKGKDGMAFLREYERRSGELPETVCSVTGRGGSHLLYRVGHEIRPSSDEGSGIDIRCDGSYIVAPPSVHENGHRYEWENDPADFDVADADDAVLGLVSMVQQHGGGVVSAMIDGYGTVAEGGRNDALYKCGCSLRARSVPPDQLRDRLAEINRRSCVPPLPSREFERIVGSVLKLPDGPSDEVRAARSAKAPAPGRFHHNDFARLLIEEHGACMVGGRTPAIRTEGGWHAMGWDAVESAATRLRDGIKLSELREVTGYLHRMAPAVPPSPWQLIGFSNGVLDVRTMELRPYADGDVITNAIPHEWNASARDDTAEAFMRTVAADLQSELALWEVMGLCLCRSSQEFPCVALLIGSGANGKSTYMHALRALLGDANVSALQPKEVARRFQAAQLVGKLANIADDIPKDRLDSEACATIKRIATGDLMFTDVKGKSGFEFEPYATQVISSNNFPGIADTTYGMTRRLLYIEFPHTFKRGEGAVDDMKARLSTEAACRYLARGAVDGLRRVMRNGGVTRTPACERGIAEIVQDSNSILMWLADQEITADDLVGKSTALVYEKYKSWCYSNGAQGIYKSREVTVTTCNQTGVTTSKKTHRETIGGVSVVSKYYEYPPGYA